LPIPWECQKDRFLLYLENLVKNGFIKKFERFEKNLKFCDYQASPEFFPEKDKKGGDENISLPVKYLHGEDDEKTSPVMKKLHRGVMKKLHPILLIYI